MTVLDRSLRYSIAAASLLFAALGIRNAAAQQIVYNNTSRSLDYRIAESSEFGSELLLGGTARTVTELSFEYFGDFLQQGDEACKVRVYANEKPYDLFRKEPTTLLFESNTFPISPGYRTVKMSGLNIPARDVITFTVETSGLGPAEGMGLLLYNPPTVGRSFSELWRRTPGGGWEAVFYQFPTADIKAKVAIRLVATNTVQLTAAKAVAGNFEFGITGLNGADLIVEASDDLKSWSPVQTNAIPGTFARIEQNLPRPEISPAASGGVADTTRFFRVRVEK